MDSLLAARLQMTVTLAFHIVLAAIGIGLPLLLVIVEGLYLRTGGQHYKSLARAWAKALGLLFAVGAVSGTALSLELGLLWPRYMELMGATVGHIFALEGYAFFLEAIFIGLYLYGWDRLKPIAHWLCALVIAASGMASGIFVLGVNAWMQQPVGFELAGDELVVTDPIAIFRQPLWLHMAVHSTLACVAAVGFAVAGWYAKRALEGRRDSYVRAALVTALGMGSIASLAQPLSGDRLAKYVFQTQPTKFAAMEGQFHTEGSAPLRIGGWPDVQTQTTRWALEIPGGLSFLATGEFAAVVPGLDRAARADWPNVELTHGAFQLMIGCGVAMAAVAVWFGIALVRRREELLSRRRMLWAIAISGPLGFLGLEAGWFVTEVGRQPWIIQGILRTADAVTPVAGIGPMFVAFSLLYAVLALTVVKLLHRLATVPH